MIPGKRQALYSHKSNFIKEFNLTFFGKFFVLGISLSSINGYKASIALGSSK